MFNLLVVLAVISYVITIGTFLYQEYKEDSMPYLHTITCDNCGKQIEFLTSEAALEIEFTCPRCMSSDVSISSNPDSLPVQSPTDLP